MKEYQFEMRLEFDLDYDIQNLDTNEQIDVENCARRDLVNALRDRIDKKFGYRFFWDDYDDDIIICSVQSDDDITEENLEDIKKIINSISCEHSFYMYIPNGEYSIPYGDNYPDMGGPAETICDRVAVTLTIDVQEIIRITAIQEMKEIQFND